MIRNAFTIASLLLLSLSHYSQAERFSLKTGESVLGEIQLVPAATDDTLSRLARRHNLGYQEIVQANRATDRWIPATGTPIVLPTRFILPDGPRSGLLINLAEMRLYFYPRTRKNEVWTFPIGIGRQGWRTPVGTTRIHSKIAQPSWTPPKSIRREAEAQGKELPAVFPPGPDNPLGDHALRLALPGYLLHGTNRPAGVGMRVSHGCIRLYPEDIAELFEHIPTNTTVRIVDQPAKLGWHDDELYLEVHPPAYEQNRLTAGNGRRGSLIRQISLLTEDTEIDWRAVTRILQNANGVPTLIGNRKKKVKRSAPTTEADKSTNAAPRTINKVEQ